MGSNMVNLCVKVETSDSHSEDTGSNPVGATNIWSSSATVPVADFDPLPCGKEGGACAQMLLRGKPTVFPLIFPFPFKVIQVIYS